MKGPKRRYLSPEQIEADIDKAKRRAQQYFEDAEIGDKEALQLYKDNRISDGKRCSELAHRRRRRGVNILEKKLPVLSQKLAEILTPQLPACDDGNSSIPA